MSFEYQDQNISSMAKESSYSNQNNPFNKDFQGEESRQEIMTHKEDSNRFDSRFNDDFTKTNEDNIGQFVDYFESDRISNLWKPIHLKAWNTRMEDPNLFFYNFHKLDEELTVSSLNQIEEETLLHIIIQIFSSSKSLETSLKRIKGKWGFLSLKLPYRNGITCYHHYLKLRNKKSEFKKDELFIEFLKEKVNDEDLAEKIKDKSFIKFFMDLSPGYQPIDDDSNFWMKEAIKILETEESLKKVDQVQSHLIQQNKLDDNNYYLIANLEKWKNIPTDNFEQILKNPYVKSLKPRIQHLPTTIIELEEDSPFRKSSPTPKSSLNKEMTAATTPAKKKTPNTKPKGDETETTIKALGMSDYKVNRSTDVSTVGGADLGKLTVGSVAKDNFSETFEERIKTRNPITKKKEPKKKKINDTQKKRINEILSKYKPNVVTYDSEPEKTTVNKGDREVPMFFSEISSIDSRDELNDTESALLSLSTMRDLNIDKFYDPKFDQLKPEKRKFNEAGMTTNLFTGKRVKNNKVTLEEEVPKKTPRQVGTNQRRKRTQKSTFNKAKKASRKMKLEKEQKLNTKTKELLNQIPQVPVKASTTKRRKRFIEDDYDDDIPLANNTKNLNISDFRDAEFDNIPETNNRTSAAPTKLKQLDLFKFVRRNISTEDAVKDIQNTFEKIKDFQDKKIPQIHYSVLSEFIEDEDELLQNFYARLLRFEQVLKKFLNILSVFSTSLFEDFDAEIMLLVKKEWNIFYNLEKEFYKITLFSTVKENMLRAGGDLGLKCLKILDSIDALLLRVLSNEAMSLKFILAWTNTDNKSSEELVIKDHLGILLKFFSLFNPFLRVFQGFFVKTHKALSDFVTQNITYYFLGDFYLSNCFKSPDVNNAQVEVLASLLTIIDDGQTICYQVVADLYSKVKDFIPYLVEKENNPSTDKTFCGERTIEWNTLANLFSNDFLVNIFRKSNDKINIKENEKYTLFALTLLKCSQRLDTPLHSILQNPNIITKFILDQHMEHFLLLSIKFIFSSFKIFQYFGNIAHLTTEFLDKMEILLLDILEASKTETQITKSLEIIFQISKICLLKSSFFFKVYDRLTKLFKNNSSVVFNSSSYDKIISSEKLTLSTFNQLVQETQNAPNKSFKLTGSHQFNIMLCPLLLQSLFSQEISGEEESKKVKLTKRIVSRSLSMIPNHQKIDETSIQDPKQFCAFLLDFALLISLISLSGASTELLRSIHLKIHNFIGNLHESHIAIRSLMLNLEIDMMNFCIPLPESLTLVAEIQEKIFLILNDLLNEFLEVSKYVNAFSRFDKSTGKELRELEEKYSKLQKLSEENIMKLRYTINNNLEFIIRNNISLFPKGNSAFLGMLNPKNPITSGLRKQVLEYLELAIPSAEKLTQLLKSKEVSPASISPVSSQIEQEDEIEFMNRLLEKAAHTSDFISNNMVIWRQNSLQYGQDILVTLYEMIMSIYNQEILTKMQPKFHIDIFLIEKGLELYAKFSKLLLFNNQITFDQVEQQLGLNSLFSSSKTSRTNPLNLEAKTKGINISRNQKLALLLQFYSTFLSFEKDQNKLVISNTHQKSLQGLENFLMSAHIVLFASSIQTISNTTIAQQEFYNVMADFALMLYSQDKNFSIVGLKEFLFASYVERGYVNEDDGRDSIGIVKKMIYNAEIFCMETEMEEKRLLFKFMENFAIMLIKNLRQDLSEEIRTTNNGKLFAHIYKNLCSLVSNLSKVFSTTTLHKPLVDILSFIFVEFFGKIGFNPAEDSLSSFDPLMLKSIMHEGINFDFKPLINATFSIPSKDKHFPRKVFVKLLIFVLKFDLEKIEVHLKNNSDQKLKIWELFFKSKTEFTLISQNFLHSLFNQCKDLDHEETLLNCLREIINYTMLEDGKIHLISPFIKALHSIYTALHDPATQRLAQRAVDVVVRLADLLGKTEFSEDEKISLLYLLKIIFEQTNKGILPEENLKNIHSICSKWILEILIKFDSNIMEKIESEGITVSNLNISLNKKAKEINEKEVKIFGVAIKLCNYYERYYNSSKSFASTLKELVQEKIKIKLSLGEIEFSSEIKKILQLLNEY